MATPVPGESDACDYRITEQPRGRTESPRVHMPCRKAKPFAVRTR
jgi:hypothetical protein